MWNVFDLGQIDVYRKAVEARFRSEYEKKGYWKCKINLDLSFLKHYIIKTFDPIWDLGTNLILTYHLINIVLNFKYFSMYLTKKLIFQFVSRLDHISGLVSGFMKIEKKVRWDVLNVLRKGCFFWLIFESYETWALLF